MTRAVILAAGFGSRLMPHTADRPKGMVELCGKPLLARQIEVLAGAGIDDILLVGGYRAGMLAQLGRPVVENPAYETTNMVVSLMCARQALDGADDTVIAYGDIVYERRVLESLLSGVGDFTVVTDRGWRELWSARMDEPAGDVESFRVGDDGSVAELGGRPGSLDEVEGQYIGLMKVPAAKQAALLAAYDAMVAPPQMYMTAFIQHLIDSAWRVLPAWVHGGWLEVDTVEDLDRYHTLAATRALDRLCLLPRIPDLAPLIALGGSEMRAAELDRAARRIEIRASLGGGGDALLASFLLDYARTHDFRRLNTVLKAPETPARAELLRWCDEALA